MAKICFNVIDNQNLLVLCMFYNFRLNVAINNSQYMVHGWLKRNNTLQDILLKENNQL